jgi:hypothetical protein
MMVTVHSYEVYHFLSDEWVPHTFKVSEERIKQIRGSRIIPGTAETVPISALDEYGRFEPKENRGSLTVP